VVRGWRGPLGLCRSDKGITTWELLPEVGDVVGPREGIGLNDVVCIHNLRGDMARDSGHGRIVHHGRREELGRHSSYVAERCGDAIHYPPVADEELLAEIGVEAAEGAGLSTACCGSQTGALPVAPKPTAQERTAQCKGMRYSLGAQPLD